MRGTPGATMARPLNAHSADFHCYRNAFAKKEYLVERQLRKTSLGSVAVRVDITALYFGYARWEF
jgi:hypothetical protein